ncbi:MAG: alpha/beta hydrolase [Rhodobiaceae bacterium]|nr:alpha/beta hydrolase [Rhodobiaceae bacterium]
MARAKNRAVGDDIGWQPLSFRSRDGTALYAREYGPRDSALMPLICLAGLSRNSKDFHELASFINSPSHAPRRILCLDYRGRGKSARDKNWRNYTVPAEKSDTLDMMVAAGIERACILGTSRGGLIAMAMAAARPGALAGVILNDIGPEIEATGMARIISYVGKMPAPADWKEAGRILKEASAGQFPRMSDDDWQAQARKIFTESKGRLVADYDPALANGLGEIDLAQSLPTMWPQFGALARVPALVIRGENSDILSEATLARMAQNHSSLETHVVRDAGHAPLLADEASMKRIFDFVRALDNHNG